MELLRVVEPVGEETPVVVEIPHAGLSLVAQFASELVAPVGAIARDADLYVDRLYEDAPLEGATLIASNASRYVIDLNRSENDVDAEVLSAAPRSPRFNHGLIWRVTSEGQRALARPLSRAELEERLTTVYRPYHRALALELKKKQAKFGIAVLLAAHSMPSVGRDPQSGGTRPRADVVPGSRNRTSAHAAYLEAVENLAKAEGWSVAHDNPYAGGFSTQFYGRPAEGVHAVQVELARRLYMDETTLRPLAREFDRVRRFCRALVRELGRAHPR